MLLFVQEHKQIPFRDRLIRSYCLLKHYQQYNIHSLPGPLNAELLLYKTCHNYQNIT